MDIVVFDPKELPVALGALRALDPRPSELQAWVVANKPRMPRSEFYPLVRRWYARDKGEATIREVAAAAGLPAVPASGESDP